MSMILMALAARSRVALRARGTWDRKWWHIEEDRDPTTLPLWQRDYRYAYQVLKRSMVEARKKGRKVFWDCRVLNSSENGCEVEMLKSGLIGFCSVSQEGATRLEVGEIYKFECTACPLPRVNKEHKSKPWPNEPRAHRANPYFSHALWVQQQSDIAKAQKLKSGMIITGKVHRLIKKGLLIELEGKDSPKGMLALGDISRQNAQPEYARKMFPPGTDIKCYVIHSDRLNGRITLSTKEFEDDDHVGWMVNFPERMFKRADEGVRRYKEKRDAYIAHLQR